MFSINVNDLLKESINKYKYELLLFGTGEEIIKIPNNMEKFLISKNIKLEIMNSISAYKIYNILLAEKRNFVSAIKLV